MAVNRVAYPLSQVVPWHGFTRIKKIIGGSVALTTTDVGTINNTVQLFTVPKGLTLTALHCEVPTSLAASALTLSLGDSGVTNRLLSASTIGVAGGKVDVLPATLLGFKYGADTDIQLLIAAAAVTPAAGSIVVFLEGFIDA